jgi:hypothetical protein
MKLINSYDIIPLESVIRNVHVVPDLIMIMIDILLKLCSNILNDNK